MFDRRIGTRVQWTKANPIDAQVLPLLNRYCFRCHSSLRYDVFDKDAVISKKGAMANRLNLAPTDKFAMPKDRDIHETHDNACLIQLLPHVGENAQISCAH